MNFKLLLLLLLASCRECYECTTTITTRSVKSHYPYQEYPVRTEIDQVCDKHSAMVMDGHYDSIHYSDTSIIIIKIKCKQ